MSVTPFVRDAEMPGKPPALGRSPHVLVLDDDPAVGRLVARIAQPLGYFVDSVSDEAGFHARYRGAVPDLVILDLQIGETDGIAQLRFLRDQSFRGGVILMSGYDAKVLAIAERLGREFGLTVITSVAKPFRAEMLAAVLTSFKARSATLSAIDVFGAIEEDELFLEYQPIVTRRPAAVLQLEALVRWQHPEQGRIPPDRFIPLAEEEPEVMDALTSWVIRTAAAQHHRLATLGQPVGVAVNISARNLDKLDFPDRVAALLQTEGVPASALCLELTETAASRDMGRTMDVLSRLRLKGMTLAIDDFGIGYSSLRALRQLPFSTLKIDRSFIADAATSRDAFVIVKAIADLARNMELASIAEGVETEEIATLVESLGVDAMQGYLIARPLAAEALPQWLDTWQQQHAHDVAAAHPVRA